MSCSTAAWRGRAGSWMPGDAVRRGTVAEPRTAPERGVWRRETVRPTARGRGTTHLGRFSRALHRRAGRLTAVPDVVGSAVDALDDDRAPPQARQVAERALRVLLVQAGS